LGDRLAAGLRTLTPSTKVRILVSQPEISQLFSCVFIVYPINQAQSAVRSNDFRCPEGQHPRWSESSTYFYLVFAHSQKSCRAGQECHCVFDVAGVLHEKCGSDSEKRYSGFAWPVTLGYSRFRGKVDAMIGARILRLQNREQATCFPLTKIPEYCFNAPLYAGPDSRSGRCLQ
jgi:hypothetical protein